MRYLSLSVAALLINGCASVDPAITLLDGVGDEVNSICFVRKVENWTTQNDSVFVFAHDSERFLVTLVGECSSLSDNSSPAYVIRRRSAASSCLNPGDSLRLWCAKRATQLLHG